MAPRGSREGGSQKGTLWRKIDFWNAFVDRALPYIPHLDSLVWMSLLRHSWDGVVTRSHGRLAKDTNVSERTIRRAMDRLENKGLIRVLKRGGLRVGASTLQLGVRDLRPRGGESEVTRQVAVGPMTTGRGCPAIADTAVTDITDYRSGPGA